MSMGYEEEEGVEERKWVSTKKWNTVVRGEKLEQRECGWGRGQREKQWWESALEGERGRGRVRSDRVTEQKEDRECEGRLRNRDWGQGGKSWSAPHRPADVLPYQLTLIPMSLLCISCVNWNVTQWSPEWWQSTSYKKSRVCEPNESFVSHFSLYSHYRPLHMYMQPENMS